VVTFQATADDRGVYTNLAEIPSHPLADPASHSLDLTHQVCLYRVTKTLVYPSSDEVEPGQVITFDLTITNTGTIAITELPLHDEFNPAHLNFLSASLPPDDAASPGVLDWADLTSVLGDLPPGQPLSLAVSFDVPVDLPAEVTSTDNLAWSKGLLCAAAQVDISPPEFTEPSFRPACQCGCEWGVELGIHNTGEVAGGGIASLFIDGEEQGSFPFHLEAHEWFQADYSWADLGLPKPGEEDRHVLVRADGAQGECQCNCPPGGDNGDGCKPYGWFDIDCWTGTVTICNPCDKPVEGAVQVIIDGQTIITDTIRLEPYASCTATQYDGAKWHGLVADTEQHTIEIRTATLGAKTVVVGPCLPLELPETGYYVCDQSIP
jgi:uncharacterized repeat protein (TIGR01451 family)